MVRANDYDMRAQDIEERLKKGYTRKELAAEYGYTSWRSLDGFMRRKGYIYKDNIYQKPEEMRERMLDELSDIIPHKASVIAQLFEEQGEEANPPEIARKFGFSSCGEMNQYMKENGLQYKSATQKYELIRENNKKLRKEKKEEQDRKENEKIPYEKQRKAESMEQSEKAGITIKQNVEGKKEEKWNTAGEQKLETKTEKSLEIERDWEGMMKKFIPMLDFLYAHKEQLEEVLEHVSCEQIPRYLVPGKPKVKSIYISDKLIQILDDFSRSRNVSIKEICEGAVIQYLAKYGYQKEVDMLLAKNCAGGGTE